MIAAQGGVALQFNRDRNREAEHGGRHKGSAPPDIAIQEQQEARGDRAAEHPGEGVNGQRGLLVLVRE